VATTQDVSLGVGVESVYKTYVAPTTFYEALGDSTLQWNKQVKQGQGLRVGSSVARAARRVVPAADGSGDFTVECASKGMGKLFQAALGSGTSTVVAGTTYQQNFTLGSSPSSLTIQQGLVEAGGTVDAYSWLGCMVSGWELSLPNNDIATLKLTVDAGDLSTTQPYAAPSYPTGVNLYHFANASIATGTFTAATATTLPAAATQALDFRNLVITASNNLTADRFNAGGGGRKSKPTRGLVGITGTADIEYDATTYRDLVLNDNILTVVATVTAGALSTGNETLCVALPAIKLDSPLPQPNGTDLIVVSTSFTVLDDLTNPPVGVYLRTADATI
jgi:hypothetical protein